VGEIVEFASNGKSAQGYLALPEGNGPGIVVIQEWWGLVDHVKDLCDRFAAEGFVALAPDLYHGKATTEPDEAGKLLMSMDIERAGKDMGGAVDYLLAHGRVQPKKIGTVGFCMGGNLALLLATLKPVDAAVAFYPYPRTEPNFANIKANVLLHIAENDQAPTPEMAAKIVQQVGAAGKKAEMFVYPGTDHAFFNDTRPEAYVPDAAKQAWQRTLDFFRENLK
jgi:carboxymethylenebutenolidase